MQFGLQIQAMDSTPSAGIAATILPKHCRRDSRFAPEADIGRGGLDSWKRRIKKTKRLDPLGAGSRLVLFVRFLSEAASGSAFAPLGGGHDRGRHYCRGVGAVPAGLTRLFLSAIASDRQTCRSCDPVACCEEPARRGEAELTSYARGAATTIVGRAQLAAATAARGSRATAARFAAAIAARPVAALVQPAEQMAVVTAATAAA